MAEQALLSFVNVCSMLCNCHRKDLTHSCVSANSFTKCVPDSWNSQIYNSMDHHAVNSKKRKSSSTSSPLPNSFSFYASELPFRFSFSLISSLPCSREVSEAQSFCPRTSDNKHASPPARRYRIAKLSRNKEAVTPLPRNPGAFPQTTK